MNTINDGRGYKLVLVWLAHRFNLRFSLAMTKHNTQLVLNSYNHKIQHVLTYKFCKLLENIDFMT